MARAAHLYRISHDGRGNWTVNRPGFPNERRYFPADHDTPSPQQDDIPAAVAKRANAETSAHTGGGAEWHLDGYPDFA